MANVGWQQKPRSFLLNCWCSLSNKSHKWKKLLLLSRVATVSSGWWQLLKAAHWVFVILPGFLQHFSRFTLMREFLVKSWVCYISSTFYFSGGSFQEKKENSESFTYVTTFNMQDYFLLFQTSLIVKVNS